MSIVRHSGTAGTADPVPAEMLCGHVSEMMETVAGGGVAIIPLDVTYAIVGHKADAIRRIFASKNRSFDKPCGMFGSWRISRELHDIEPQKHEMVRILAVDEQLPFSVVAPFRPSHPLLAAVDPEVIRNSSKTGTMDMVINGGFWLEEIARQSAERNVAVFGSSANRSLNGSKYRLSDIEPEVREAAAVSFDYGLSRYETPLGLSSTIVDLRDFSVVRVGHRFEEIAAAMLRRFGVTLKGG
jgi:tRNA A37 threonylcarbamoyladenosine synthetase subunit TsaC/SUA5/YrdC